jgi:hypothetical protein
MKLNYNQASMLVFAMMVLSALNLLALVSWHSISLGYDLIIQREKTIKRFYRAEILFNMGIVFAKNSFDAFVRAVDKSKTPIAVNLTEAMWDACGIKSNMIEGAVFVCKPNVKDVTNTLHIKAILQEKNSAPFVIQCWLQKKTKVLENGKKGDVFVIKYFTFGASV